VIRFEIFFALPFLSVCWMITRIRSFTSYCPISCSHLPFSRVELASPTWPKDSPKQEHCVLKCGGGFWALLERLSLPFRLGLYKNPKFYVLLPYLLFNTFFFTSWPNPFPLLTASIGATRQSGASGSPFGEQDLKD
jgi:hypothetical protein